MVCIFAGNSVDNSWIFLLLLSSACIESSIFLFLTPHPTAAEGFESGHSQDTAGLSWAEGYIPHPMTSAGKASEPSERGAESPTKAKPTPPYLGKTHTQLLLFHVFWPFSVLCLCSSLALRAVQLCPAVPRERLFTARCLPSVGSQLRAMPASSSPWPPILCQYLLTPPRHAG